MSNDREIRENELIQDILLDSGKNFMSIFLPYNRLSEKREILFYIYPIILKYRVSSDLEIIESLGENELVENDKDSGKF